MKEHQGFHRAVLRAEREAARYRELSAKAEKRAGRTFARELRKAREATRRQESRLTSYQRRFEIVARQRDDQAAEIVRLRDHIKRGTTPQIDGLLEEGRLLKLLQNVFPHDRFNHTGKGGDIVQTVMCEGEPAGVIVYECKKAKFLRKFLLQTIRARQQRGAAYALLVTSSLPKKDSQCWVERGVIVITPQAVIAVAMTARGSLETMHRMRATGAERMRAVRAIYDYLAGPEYQSRVENAAGELVELQRELAAERKWHDTTWQKRIKHYAAVSGEIAVLDQRLRAFLSRSGRGPRILTLAPLRRNHRRSRRRSVA